MVIANMIKAWSSNLYLLKIGDLELTPNIASSNEILSNEQINIISFFDENSFFSMFIYLEINKQLRLLLSHKVLILAVVSNY